MTETPTVEQMVATLRDLRLARDVTYRVLADEVGVPEATLYRALNGKPINERTEYKLRRYIEPTAA